MIIEYIENIAQIIFLYRYLTFSSMIMCNCISYYYGHLHYFHLKFKI